MELNNKVVIITGASKGIGRSIALKLASKQCSLVLTGRDQKTLEEVAIKCRSLDSKVSTVVCDLERLDSINSIIDIAKKDYGKINIVINNAGFYQRGNPYENDLRDWDKSLTVNLQAPYHLTNKAIKEIPANEEGAIYFISSIAGKITYSTGGAYCMAKHGLAAYANCLFEDLRNQDIRVTTFFPGFVNTDMGREDHLDSEKMIQPEEFAEQVLFCLENSNSSCIRELTVSPRVSPRKNQ